jgi:hypothetical protein
MGMVNMNMPGKRQRNSFRIWLPEEDKCKDDKPENGVPEDFADDVAVQDAHGENGECNTAATASSGRIPEVPHFAQLPAPRYESLITPKKESAWRSREVRKDEASPPGSGCKQFTCSK